MDPAQIIDENFSTFVLTPRPRTGTLDDGGMKMDLIPGRVCLLGILLTIWSLSEGAKASFDVETNGIYGADDRMEYYQSPVEIQRRASAVGVMVRTTDLFSNGSILGYDTRSYGLKAGLCNEEPFQAEPSIGSCTAFLISPTLMVTAGHCVQTATDCSGIAVVFGFNVTAPNALPALRSQDAYKCKRVVAQELSGSHDYAVIELDRPATGRVPLTIATTAVLVGEPVAVMGYPSGLPFKFAAGANVRSWSPDQMFFDANLDTYAGNSGSPVINQRGEVAGILVRGGNDYEFTDKFCRRSVVVANDAGRGESVTSIALVKTALAL